MKKNLTYLAAALAFLMTAACSKAEQETPAPAVQETGNKVTKVFGASGESNEFYTPAAVQAGTRTTIAAGMAVEWLASDEIAVFDGVDKNVFTIKSSSGSSATFEGYVDEGASSFYAAYPASLATGLSGSVIATEIPSVQVVPDGGNVGDGALVAVAYTDGSSFAFKNVCSLLKFTISDAGITSVVITSIGGQSLTGACNVTVSATPTLSFTAGVPTVTVRPAGETFAAGTYYAAIAPGDYTGGLAVVMTRNSDAKGGVKQSSSDLSVVRNNGSNLGSILSASCDWGTYITNLSELQAWSSSGSFSESAILGADIAVGEWYSYFRSSAFTGTFYGLGHKLYNITCTASSGSKPAAFLYLPTNVNNLIIGSSDGENWDGVSTFTLGASSNGYCGLFAYSKDGGEYKNIVNYAKFEASTAHTGSSFVRIGAFAGATNGGVFTNCKNYGSVTCNAQTTASETGVGGFFGFVDQKADPGYTTRLIDCENHGDISNSCPRAQYIGGFYGRTGHTGNINPMKEITRCKNYGNISVHNGVSPLRVGGICAEAYYTVTLSYCENHGNIESDFIATNIYLAGIAAEVQGDAKDGSGDQAVILDHCSNAGAITVGQANFALEGGLTGYSKNISLKNCTNSGTVTLNNSSEAKTNRCDVGGLVAYGTDVIRIGNCENTGNVSAAGNTSGDISAGGIMGDTYWVKYLKTNTNRGEISASNAGSGKAAAGGIMGSDFQGTSNNGNWTETNKNYGAVSATGTVAYAGGIFGCGAYMASWGDWNYGAITCSVAANAGSLMGFSGNKYVKPWVGGSVNGTALSSSNWTEFIVGSSSTGEYQSGSGAGGFVSL